MSSVLIPVSLSEKIKNKEVCFFLGAGISISQSKDIKGCPSSTEFAKILLDNLKNKDEIENNEITDIIKLSSELVWQTKSRLNLNNLLKETFGNPSIKPLPTHKLLANFDIPLVTTNFDRLIELAHENINTRLTVITEENQLTSISAKNNLLIKIHGDITNPTRCVITEDDYYSWMSNNSDLKNMIRVWMITKTIIFIGYSISDINFRQLIIELIRKFDNLFSEIYFVTPFIDTTSYNYRFITNNLNAHFIKMDAEEFLKSVSEIINKSKYQEASLKYLQSSITKVDNQETIDKLIANLLYNDIKLNCAGNVTLTSNIGNEVYNLFHNDKIYPNFIEIINDIDDSQMVLIPKGEFIMGGDRLGNETIRVENIKYDYYIDNRLITTSQYKLFLSDVNANKGLYEKLSHPKQPKSKVSYYPSFDAKSNIPPEHFQIKFILIEEYFETDTYNEYPVVYIDWWDAYAYANWAGKKLPSEGEWEKAARGNDGRNYPYGNSFDPAKCNVAESKIFQPTPVSKYSDGVSPYGCYDMCGNVWEWCENDFDFQKDSSDSNSKIVKGGSATRGAERSHCAFRNARDPNDKWFLRGFRCVKLIS